MSVFGVIRVRIFPHSDWIRRDTPYLSVFSRMRENADQNNFKYGHFLRSEQVAVMTSSISFFKLYELILECIFLNCVSRIVYLRYTFFHDFFIYWHHFKSIQWKIVKNNWSKSTPSPLYVVTNHKSSNSIKYIYKDNSHYH